MATTTVEGPKKNYFAVAAMLGVFIPGIHAVWRPRIIGRENMPTKGPCFVFGNHSMYLDPFVVNIFFGMDPTAGIMAREFLRKGPVAWFMRNIGIVPVSRNDGSVIRAIFKMIEAGRKITIYPEGGRRWDGRPLPWIPSTVKLYQKTGLPVYTVVNHGSYVAWPRWAKYPRPARLKLEFLPPVTVTKEESLENAEQRLRAPIDFDDSLVEDEVKPKWAYRPADGIDILLYRDPITGKSGDIFTPDGRMVKNREGSLSFEMQPDSTLKDLQTGEVVTTGDLFSQVRSLPLPRLDDGSIVSNLVDVKFAASFPEFESWGAQKARLHDDAILIEGIDRNRWPLEDVLSVQIERNWKLQINFESGILQLGFLHGGSALQWSDHLTSLGLERH